MYKRTDPNHVKFQRIVMGWLAIASLFLREIDLVWIFFAITSLGLLTGTEYSAVTLLYKLVRTLFKWDLVHISKHHIRYYQINVSMDVIDHLLRFMASAAALGLFYIGMETAAWLLMAFLSIFMMLSAYFGFCLSALTYIAIQSLFTKVRGKTAEGSLANCDIEMGVERTRLNENCILARQCFTPYQRCDSCHINITECLGTKFNSLVLLIGILMSLFLFISHPIFVQTNIVLIMGLIFWLGYQVNYNTDALAQTNNDNIILNEQLKEYTQSLEEEVRRRTAEIEHLATHDMLTGLVNRFSFEKLLDETMEELDDTQREHLAFIDLDKFKMINDTVGHLAGDRLLREMSEMFVAIVKEDGTVARLGGDEFGILFSGISFEEARARCQEICDTTAAYEFMDNNQAFKIGTSIGVATLTTSMQDINAALHHADEACYMAKKSGRNQVCQYQPQK